MILVIDGMPKTGKTTLAKHFRADLSLQFEDAEIFDPLHQVSFQELSSYPEDISWTVWREWESSVFCRIESAKRWSIPLIIDGGLILERFYQPLMDSSNLDAILANANAFLLCLTDSPITIYRRLQEADLIKIYYSRRQIIEGHQRCLEKFRSLQIVDKGSFKVDQFLIKESGTLDSYIKTDHYQNLLKTISSKWQAKKS